MHKTGPVSVVIPAYQAGETIEAAMASIDAQWTRPDEIILVDDASPDGSAALLQERYGARPDVRLILREQNGGPAAARNTGVAVARNAWIAFLDGDDAWLPHRLESQLTLAGRHSDVAMWCGMVSGWEPGEDRGGEHEGARYSGGVATWRPLMLEEFVYHNPVATSTVLIRREVLEAVGGFDEQFRGPEDYDLWMRVVHRYPAARVERALSRYRRVAGSLSMDERRFLPQVLRVLDKAFAQGGALYDLKPRREVALTNQYWNASWMAFNRGARIMALAWWARAFVVNVCAGWPLKRAWAALLWRYAIGRKDAGSGPAE